MTPKQTAETAETAETIKVFLELLCVLCVLCGGFFASFKAAAFSSVVAPGFSRALKKLPHLPARDMADLATVARGTNTLPCVFLT